MAPWSTTTLQGIRGFALAEYSGWGQLVARPLSALGGHSAGRDWLVPATLIDAAFYACGIHLWAAIDEVVSLPESIAALRLGRMPADHEPCLVHFQLREIDERHAVYDFTIFGADRSTILVVEGYRSVMLRKPGRGADNKTSLVAQVYHDVQLPQPEHDNRPGATAGRRRAPLCAVD